MSRSEHDAAPERMAAAVAPGKLARRKPLIEHPWGTLKLVLPGGLVRGKVKMGAEGSLIHFSYKLKRVLAVVGLAKLLAALKEWKPNPGGGGKPAVGWRVECGMQAALQMGLKVAQSWRTHLRLFSKQSPADVGASTLFFTQARRPHTGGSVKMRHLSGSELKDCRLAQNLSLSRRFRRDMNIKFQRLVDRYLGVPICAAFSVLDQFLRRPVADVVPKRILVILLSEMGSLVLAQGMFARLKEKYPNARIHALLFSKNREVLSLLDVVAETDMLTVDDRSLGKFLPECFRAIRTMRRLHFDVVIDCELFARVSSIFSFLSGATIRVGFHAHTQEGLYRGSFINRRVLYNPYKHVTQQFLALVAAIESHATPRAKEVCLRVPPPPLPLPFPPAELAQVAAQLHTDFPAIAGKRLLLVYPSGGLLPIRAWPMEHYRKLCSNLLRDGYAVGIIGLPDDKPLGQDLMAHCQSPFCIDLVGYTKSVRHLLALFHRASLLVTNDGGPGQFAALTSVPTIIFFGPETPVLYGTLSRQAHCFHLGLPCSPCLTAYNHRTSPCDGDNQCLKQITPEQVLAKAREMLKAESSCQN